MLAERVEWLETQYNSQQAEKNLRVPSGGLLGCGCVSARRKKAPDVMPGLQGQRRNA